MMRTSSLPEHALGERRAHVDIGNDVDAVGDHVAHHGADLIVAFAAGTARRDRFGIDLGVNDLDVDAFLGEKAGFQRHRGVLHMKGVPAGVTDS